ncbi:hypothetical protein ABZ816_21515 [Actinosynnema sp. NPDC047251]|uniref:Uncharacterized protein n=1 Tax=Saccharothrix espanaensis (strain ATCC 51144 / DSM 44229 / JCM 9112 / NBRC 15066 / NRRL 15764) TaxID=1179773 RepID=K0K0N9_SACES|nr:hypothetical protein [Saccharothrix espanaensis]CCH33820.1 hypothetical protein BN6_65820 [Saccharothrix espanaensis DSM 44229]
MSRRALGVVLAVIAAATAVLATFLPFSWIGTGLGRDTRFGFTTTGWGTRSEPAELGGIAAGAQTGVPVVIAAVLLVVGAALVFLPAHQRQAGRYTAVAATGLLAGSVWTTFMVVSASLSPSFRDARARVDYEYGAGLWLLVAACVVAIAATAYLHAKPPAPAPEGVIVRQLEDDVDTDTATPPFGISVPVLPEGYLRRPAAAPEPSAGPVVGTPPERTT